MGAAVDAELVQLLQALEGLVQERGGVQQRAALVTPQSRAGQPAQLLVDGSEQLRPGVGSLTGETWNRTGA